MTDIDKILKILIDYAEEKGVPVRSTSDLSMLESWLLLRLAKLTGHE